MNRRTTLGVIVGNRDFFPAHLCETGRAEILKALEEEGIDAVILDPEETRVFGAVEKWSDAKKCAELFKANRDRIDGILVTLPNFGDERSIADAIRLSGLECPGLGPRVPGRSEQDVVEFRRDSFCGKTSVCNNLRQYGIPFSLTTKHTVSPDDPSFREDLRRFAAVCRVVRGVRGVRLGAVGTRPAAFNTVRYSEKILEAAGITVVPIDLGEVLGLVEQVPETTPPSRKSWRPSRRTSPPKGFRPKPSPRWPASVWCWTGGWRRTS